VPLCHIDAKCLPALILLYLFEPFQNGGFSATIQQLYTQGQPDLSLRLLFLGEIVGKAGVFCIKSGLKKLKKSYNADFVIANGDGTTGGFGMGKNHSIYLRKLGIDVLTSGDQIYFKKDMVPHIEKAYYILRPVNHLSSNPGRGWRYYTVGEQKVAVINFLGQAGFGRVHASNPFTYLPELAERIRKETPFIIVDFHALTTAEKWSMFHLADGMVSAVIGTGQRVLTADAQVRPHGTGVICDAGRVGSIASVSGLDPAIEMQKFLRQVPQRSGEAWEGLEIQGVALEIDDEGKTTSIESFRHQCDDAGEHTDDGNSESSED